MNGGEQLEFASMPQRLFSCTPSRLSAFDCPRRYRFTYLDRPTPQRGMPWAHNTVGAVVHVALHRWWQLPLHQRTADNGAMLVHRRWQHDGFRDEAQSLQWSQRAAEWVREYLADVDPHAEPLGVERTVATRTDRLAVSGRVDRLDERGPDGDVVIVDYKTGRHRPDTDDARGSLALALYVLGARRTLRRRCRRVELHHLASGTVAAYEHTDESLQRHIQRAEATADDIVVATDTLASLAHDANIARAADELFPAIPGNTCSWCDFRRHCPAGLAASRTLQPWDGLADERTP